MRAPYFDLMLTPNRPMAVERARWVVIAVAAVMGLTALRMAVLGAWPVIPFALADAALFWWAMRASARATNTFQQVRLDERGLLVREPRREVRLEPFWTRARIDGRRLWLAERQRRVTLGAFLSAEERRQVHAVLSAGLSRWREGRG
jgi:uncharacterized membrane protein